ncbi:alpha/beta hydrolase [Phytohalomonas tamaricis]|uniref:alpha/beta hydrolase n=1 Tax=Phytohalomonas tamaricis TaxID=2081032 RepID=UPI000D0B3316|nr:alpha/beta hydrolase [Phytohalomonas tamaricis]
MHPIDFSNLIVQLKSSALDLSGEVSTVRKGFSEMMSGLPLLDDLVYRERDIGGVRGIWGEGPWSESDHVLLYIHGGAYGFGSARDYLSLASNLAQDCGARFFTVDYRLAPEHSYPAALEDILSAYRGLLEQGYTPRQIVVAGDSAGGGASVAMLTAARNAGLPMPAAIAVFSPWCDLSLSGCSMQHLAEVDYLLTREGLAKMAKCYIGERNPQDPLISPIYANLTGLPPMLIQVGSHEILLSDATRLAEKAGMDDVDVQLHIWPEMFHVWQMFASALGASRKSLNLAGTFLREHSSTSA